MATATSDSDALLSALMSSDNAERRQAEATWEDMKRRVPDEVLELMCRVLGRRDAGSEGLRAMAAVLLRTLFDFRSDVWRRLQPHTKTGVKAALLGGLTEEPVAHVRRKLTHAVGQLAGVSSSESEWPELMALTIALCSPTQESPELKVVGLDLVNILAEFCPESLSAHEAGLIQMFDACLGDADASIRVSALKACCSFLQDLDTSGGGSLTPGDGSIGRKMVSVLQAAVEAEDGDAARDILEALNIVAAKQPGFLIGWEGETLGVVGEALLSLVANPSLEVSTRELSLEFITTVFESAPSVAREKGTVIVPAVVPLTIRMLAQAPEDDGDDLAEWLSKTDEALGGEDGDSDEDELATIAASALSRIAIALGGKSVLSSALPVCSEFLGDASNWRRRKAGLLTLLFIGEGCGEDMASSGLLPQIVLGPVVAGIADEDPRVRHAALSCLSQMAEDFGEWNGGDDDEGEPQNEGSFQGTFHAQVLPFLVQSLGGPNANIPRLQAAAASAVIAFCNPTRMRAEWLHAPVPPSGVSIAEVMLTSLRDLLRDSPSLAAREEALTAAGCVAQILGPGFAPFYGEFVPLAKEILGSTPPAGDHASSTDTLRGKAMEAIALMGAAVGVDVFRGDAHQVIRILISEQKNASRDPGNPQSTYTLNSLARMAGVLGPEFLPYLDDAVAPLLAGLSLDAEIKVCSASSAATAREELEEAGLTPLEMELRGLGRQVFGVNTSLMQAKESACRTLFQYTEDLGEAFAPYAARTLAVVLPNLGPRNAVAVQVVSAAIVPRLVTMAKRRALSGGEGGIGEVGKYEALLMMEASIRALCEVVSRIEGDLGEMGSGSTAADMEPACIAADSLSTLLEEQHSGGVAAKQSQASASSTTTTTLSATPSAVEMEAVRVLRNAARGSMRRSEAQARASAAQNVLAGGLTTAVDLAEREEQEAWEEDLMTSSVDGIGWVIKGRREGFLPAFESMLKPDVLGLLQQLQAQPTSMPASHQSFALCLAIDVLEQCGEGGRWAIFRTLLPALLRGCCCSGDDNDGIPPSTIQACAYGLGVAGDMGGKEFDAFSAEAFRLLMSLVERGREELEGGAEEFSCAADNAVSAALRLVFSRLDPIAASLASGMTTAESPQQQQQQCLAPVIKNLLGMLPLSADVIEGRDCHRRVVDLVFSRNRVILGGESGGNVPEVVRALGGMMAYQPDDDEGGQMFGKGGGGEQLWERQLVDKETRKKAELAVESLRNGFPQAFEEAWASLGEDLRLALRTPTC